MAKLATRHNPTSVARMFRWALALTVPLAAPCAARAATCTSGTPAPLSEQWVAAKYKSNKANIHDL